jgi:probable FeS assembly SUF system protein SufT
MYGASNEAVTLSRDCTAVSVPEGVEIVLPKGTVATISQALGCSFTVYVRGKMFRVAGEHADALGKERPKLPELPPNPSTEDIENLIWSQLRGCFDPEIPVNLVDLGLIYDCNVRDEPGGGRSVSITMTLTQPSCGMGPVLAADIKRGLERIPTVSDARVEVVFEPRWTPDRMTPVGKLQTGIF